MNMKLIQTENIRHALQFFLRNAISINPLHRETCDDARKELYAMTVRLAELEAVLSAGALLEFQEWPNKPPAGSTVLMVWKDGTYEVMDNWYNSVVDDMSDTNYWKWAILPKQPEFDEVMK